MAAAPDSGAAAAQVGRQLQGGCPSCTGAGRRPNSGAAAAQGLPGTSDTDGPDLGGGGDVAGMEGEQGGAAIAPQAAAASDGGDVAGMVGEQGGAAVAAQASSHTLQPQKSFSTQDEFQAYLAELVEQLRDPSLKGKAVAVQQHQDIIAVNALAKAAGVVKHAPPAEARRLLAPLGGRVVHVFTADGGRVSYQPYREASARLLRLLRALPWAAVVEKASIDEAFVLLQGQTGTEAAAAASAAAELGEGDGDDADGEEPGWAAQAALHRAQEVKAAVLRELGLIVSVGAAPNRLMAKLASAAAKPDGVRLLADRRASLALLAQTPARRLPRYGGRAAEVFEQHGVSVATDLQRFTQQQLEQMLACKPAAAAQLAQWCRGLDDTPVQDRGPPKSLSVQMSLTPQPLPMHPSQGLTVAVAGGRAGVLEPLVTGRTDFRLRVRQLMAAMGGDLLQRVQEDRAEEHRWPRTLSASLRAFGAGRDQSFTTRSTSFPALGLQQGRPARQLQQRATAEQQQQQQQQRLQSAGQRAAAAGGERRLGPLEEAVVGSLEGLIHQAAATYPPTATVVELRVAATNFHYSAASAAAAAPISHYFAAAPRGGEAAASDAAAGGACLGCRRSMKESPQTCLTALDTSQPAPRAPKKPVVLRANSSFSDAVAHERTDDYAYLRDDYRNSSAVLSHLQSALERAMSAGAAGGSLLPPEATAVLSHLQEENAYAEAVLLPSLPLQQRLTAEMLARIPQEEASVPQRHGSHWYYSIHSAGKQYRRHCRRPLADPAVEPSEHDSMDVEQPEETLLDEDELAAGRSYFDMTALVVSPDESLAAYGVDTEGSEVYTLFVLNLTSGEVLLDSSNSETFAGEFRLCAGELVFLSDSRTLLFTTLTLDTHRPNRVWRYNVAAQPTVAGRHKSRVHQPSLVFEEGDERFHLLLWRSRSEAAIFLRGSSETTHYLQYLPASGAAHGTAANFTVLAPAVQDQRIVVGDWVPTSSSSSGDGNSSKSSSESIGCGGGSGAEKSDSGDGGEKADSGGGGGNSTSESSGGESRGSGSGGGASVAYLYALIYTAEQRNGQLVVTQLGPNALDAAADASGSRVGGGGGASGSKPAAPAPAPVGDGGARGSGGAEPGSPEGGGAAGNGTAGPYWALLQAHSWDVELVDLEVSSGHLAVLERRNGTLVATAYPLPDDGSPLSTLPKGQQFSFEAPSFSLWFGAPGPYHSPLLRVRYSSLTQPLSTYDINMRTGNRVLKQQQEVQGYLHAQYLSRLLWAPSTGGAQVPVSMAYRGDLVKLDGSDPLLLEAYGAYGVARDPEFSSVRLSLLDRGFIFAVAHVRGGGELGQYWYEDGKLLAKNHTFDDMAAAADFLIQAKYTSARRLALWGRSAGGLTAGAAINRNPGLFKAAILDVPFVDVVSTMSDPSLPLTVIEWEEWGNPLKSEADYENMLSYSPVDNVVKQPYPHLLLTAGLNDPRVSFWEPAKLAAKIRALKTSPDSLVLLRTNMGAGHFAQSGLEDRLAETAFKYAFLLQTVAPCAVLSEDQPEFSGCRGCFPIFVAAATTAALVTLVVVLHPKSRLGRNWRRLGAGAGEGGGGRRGLGLRLGSLGLGGANDDDDEEEEEGEGYDTRLYASHLSDAELAEEAVAEAERQRRLRRQQLEQQGLSLTPYDDVRSAVRSQLPAAPAAGVVAAPPRRLNLGSGGGSPAAGGSLEMAAMNGGGGAHRGGPLSAIPESPTLSSSSLTSA
ncbi:protease 2 isoform A [Micractinium conductrix]|nr:protease 2 isoform A [Micractinium conductrix]|eukprot:PSC72656.1 protease 2 isoform A [Micractinium conductrix]